MLLYGATSTTCSMICPKGGQTQLPRKKTISLAYKRTTVAAAATAAALVLSSVVGAGAIELLYGATSTRCSMICLNGGQTQLPRKKTISLAYKRATVAAAATAAALLLSSVVVAGAIEVAAPQQPEETLSNVPQTLSSECSPEQQDCNKRVRIQRPKSRKAETCTSKCVATCIQGGFGSPGEGPFNIRRPLVVFKDGFRSRKYCLAECSDICNLIGDGDDGP